MAAVALVEEVRKEGRTITEADLDGIRNICRCGTYTRIREAIQQGEAAMLAAEVRRDETADESLARRWQHRERRERHHRRPHHAR
jgi:hypothetical protein